MRYLAALLLWSTTVFGFSTAYVEFEHPDGWRCDLSQGVWICQSTVEADRKESVVLSIATNATEWDTLDNYENYLKQTRTINDEEGKPLTSKVTYTRRRNINGTVWVDSLHFNSELPGFWARYVSTVHNKLAILITYIVSDEYYSRLAPQFERMVASLKPKADFDLSIPSKQIDGELPGSRRLGVNDLIRDRLNTKKVAAKPQEPAVPAEPPRTGALLLVAGAILLLLVGLRMRRKKK